MNSTNKTRQRINKFLFFSKSYLPSIITLFALSISFSSLICALEGKIKLSVLCVWVGGFLDALDGRLARYLKACSQFGAEIDSLADLISFGVSPVLIVFFTQLNNCKEYKLIGWGSCVTYICCMVIRLARFNVRHFPNETLPNCSTKFFKGIPAPAGATLLMAPIYFSFTNIYILCPPIFYIFWIFFCSSLLVSNIRTFSGKGKLFKCCKTTLKFITLSLSIVLISTIYSYVSIWYISTFFTTTYLVSFPFSHMIYRGCYKNQLILLKKK